MTSPTSARHVRTILSLLSFAALLLASLAVAAAASDSDSGGGSCCGPLASLTSSLTTPSSPLEPPFTPGTTVYDQQVPYSSRSVIFRAVLNESALAAALADEGSVQIRATWNEGQEFTLNSNEETEPLTLGQEDSVDSSDDVRAPAYMCYL